jgi:Ion channel
MFLFHLFIGAFLICLTVIVHAIALDWLLVSLERWRNGSILLFKKFWKIPILVGAVLGVFCAHITEIWIWALFYLLVGALNDLESALYFSTITFTTVGYGDIVLARDWRLVSSFEAANGFILFGWSTAFIFEIMSKLYEQRN